jgi:asparagine synthase (glutamine-hydrolysing)
MAAVEFALAGIRGRIGDPVRWAVAHPVGLIVSHPFLDLRVLRAGLRFVANTRPDPEPSKPLLRAAMRGAVPEPILTRRRKGHFNEVYYRGLLRNRDRLVELVHDPAVAGLGILDAEAVAATLDRGALGGLGVPDMHQLNLALTLAQWLLQEAQRSSPAGQRGGEGEEGGEQAGTAQRESALAGQPRQGAFDDPAVPAEPLTGSTTASGGAPSDGPPA